jgi:hypothetical protein
MFKAKLASSSSSTLTSHGKHLYFYCAGEDKASLHAVLSEAVKVDSYVSVTLVFHIRFDMGAMEDVWGRDASAYELDEDDDEGGATITIQSLIDIGLLSKKDKELSSKQELTRDDEYVTLELELDGTDKAKQPQRGVYVPLTQARRDRVSATFAQSSQASIPKVGTVGDKQALFSLLPDKVAFYSLPMILQSSRHPQSTVESCSTHPLSIAFSSSVHPLIVLYPASTSTLTHPLFVLQDKPVDVDDDVMRDSDDDEDGKRNESAEPLQLAQAEEQQPSSQPSSQPGVSVECVVHRRTDVAALTSPSYFSLTSGRWHSQQRADKSLYTPTWNDLVFLIQVSSVPTGLITRPIQW